MDICEWVGCQVCDGSGGTPPLFLRKSVILRWLRERDAQECDSKGFVGGESARGTPAILWSSRKLLVEMGFMSGWWARWIKPQKPRNRADSGRSGAAPAHRHIERTLPDQGADAAAGPGTPPLPARPTRGCELTSEGGRGWIRYGGGNGRDVSAMGDRLGVDFNAA